MRGWLISHRFGKTAYVGIENETTPKGEVGDSVRQEEYLDAIFTSPIMKTIYLKGEKEHGRNEDCV